MQEVINVFLNFTSKYSQELILSLIAINIIILIWMIINSVKIASLKNKNKKLSQILKSSNGESLEDAILKVTQFREETNREIDDIVKKIILMEEDNKQAIKNIGFIRYNAFGDMGSDLSFSLALLDKQLDGVVVTSIYGRDESNVYAKPIEAGKSEYKLSVEEVQALDRAKSKNL